jgi:hypothetical protein
MILLLRFVSPFVVVVVEGMDDDVAFGGASPLLVLLTIRPATGDGGVDVCTILFAFSLIDGDVSLFFITLPFLTTPLLLLLLLALDLLLLGDFRSSIAPLGDDVFVWVLPFVVLRTFFRDDIYDLQPFTFRQVTGHKTSNHNHLGGKKKKKNEFLAGAGP